MGLSTTFIHKNDSETILLDLKQLLIQSKQKVPLVLQTLEYDAFKGSKGKIGEPCPTCGGLGHRVSDCPKLTRTGAAPGKRDFTSSEW